MELRFWEWKTALLRRLWAKESQPQSGWKAALVRGLRILHWVARELWDGQLTLQAMSLVYTTLIALVPLLAVSFSVLKAFGVHNKTEPLLLNLLRPLGPKGTELSRQIIEFVDRMEVGVLGSVGVALLIYSVVSLIQKVEVAFNNAWHISRPRRITQRIGEYLSFILVGPVLIFAALGFKSSLMETAWMTRLLAFEPLGIAVRLSGKVLPYLLVIAAFTLFYRFVPNTRVNFGSALVGALVGGFLWETVGWTFASFVVNSARYVGLYSGFAILLMFMIWLYLSWLSLLLGASVAFYHQHPEYLGIERSKLELSARLKEKLALLAMFLIGQRHYRGGRPWTVEDMAQRVNLPPDLLSEVLEELEGRGLVTLSGGTEPGFLPARALDTITLDEVLSAVRTAEEGSLLSVERLPVEPPVDALSGELEAAVTTALEGRTVRDLVVGAESKLRPVMVAIRDGLEIDDSELSFVTTRSSGPGGQNVNKVESRVTLLFDLEASEALSETMKRRIRATLGGRINKAGVLRVVSQKHRTQAANRAETVERFAGLLREALTPRKTRRKGSVPRRQKERRLREKRKRAERKKQRRSVPDD